MPAPLSPRRTYATADSARAAVAKAGLDGCTFLLCVTDSGRFYPVMLAGKYGGDKLLRKCSKAGFATPVAAMDCF